MSRTPSYNNMVRGVEADRTKLVLLCFVMIIQEMLHYVECCCEIDKNREY